MTVVDGVVTRVYSPAPGSAFCTPVPAGYAPLSSSAITACEAGHYSAEGTGDCKECERGRFQNETAAGECAPCPPGRYGDARGLRQCPPLPRGTASEAQGLSNLSAALDCNSGRYQDEPGQTHCKVAAVGYFVPDDAQGAVGQTPCPPGSFSNRTASSACLRCPPHTFAPSEASARCGPCNGAVTDGRDACAPCPAGTRSGDGPGCVAAASSDLLASVGFDNPVRLAAGGGALAILLTISLMCLRSWCSGCRGKAPEADPELPGASSAKAGRLVHNPLAAGSDDYVRTPPGPPPSEREAAQRLALRAREAEGQERRRFLDVLRRLPARQEAALQDGSSRSAAAPGAGATASTAEEGAPEESP